MWVTCHLILLEQWQKWGNREHDFWSKGISKCGRCRDSSGNFLSSRWKRGDSLQGVVKNVHEFQSKRAAQKCIGFETHLKNGQFFKACTHYLGGWFFGVTEEYFFTLVCIIAVPILQARSWMQIWHDQWAVWHNLECGAIVQSKESVKNRLMRLKKSKHYDDRRNVSFLDIRKDTAVNAYELLSRGLELTLKRSRCQEVLPPVTITLWTHGPDINTFSCRLH